MRLTKLGYGSCVGYDPYRDEVRRFFPLVYVCLGFLAGGQIYLAVRPHWAQAPSAVVAVVGGLAAELILVLALRSRRRQPGRP